MTTAARFDFKTDADEKAIVAKAAALMGTTMAGFVGAAAKEKAQLLLDREARLTLTDRDFTDRCYRWRQTEPLEPRRSPHICSISPSARSRRQPTRKAPTKKHLALPPSA